VPSLFLTTGLRSGSDAAGELMLPYVITKLYAV
jgi:hypothetical protein